MSTQKDKGELAAYLRQVMQDRAFTSMKTFAAYCGVSYGTMYKILNGESVRAEMLKTIATNLKIDQVEIMRKAGYVDERQRPVDPDVERLAAMISSLSDEQRETVYRLIRAIIESRGPDAAD